MLQVCERSVLLQNHPSCRTTDTNVLLRVWWPGKHPEPSVVHLTPGQVGGCKHLMNSGTQEESEAPSATKKVPEPSESPKSSCFDLYETPSKVCCPLVEKHLVPAVLLETFRCGEANHTCLQAPLVPSQAGSPGTCSHTLGSTKRTSRPEREN